jgi:hypothetical protein
MKKIAGCSLGVYMNHSLLVMSTCVLSSRLLFALAPHTCELNLKPLWQELQTDDQSLGGRWILVGTLTFRKKVLEPINLTTLMLSWHGNKIDTLQASLYRTEINEPFLAINDYWVADGGWSTEKQRLRFKMDHTKGLSAITTFHLVLTVPANTEQALKTGFFAVERSHLPLQYQETHNQTLAFNF